ncbi:hypothetical protein HN51_053441 [Arachis hypogaea]
MTKSNLLLIVLLVSAMSTTIQVSKAMTCRELWLEQSDLCKEQCQQNCTKKYGSASSSVCSFPYCVCSYECHHY